MTSAGRLPPLPSSRLSLVSASSQSQVSMTSRRSDVTTSEADDEWWVGAPEAISSVRRPRKSVSEQAHAHQWKRSRSLKEKVAQVPTSRVSLSRSQSLRNGGAHAGRLLRAGSGFSEASVSPSASEVTLQLSVECLTLDADVAAQLNQTPAMRRLGMRAHLHGQLIKTNFMYAFWLMCDVMSIYRFIVCVTA